MSFATLSRRLAALGAVATLLAAARVARAQDADSTLRRPDDDAVCLGFAFGGFTPKLDWEKAGHRAIRDSSSLQHAPSGRDWAADIPLQRDSALYLFPSWWPVGVLVQLPTRRPAAGDTVSGTATALVARGEITPPVAKVRAWRVPCGGAPASVRPGAPDSTRAAEKKARKISAPSGTRPRTMGILRRSP